jgi:hypothetical protein
MPATRYCLADHLEVRRLAEFFVPGLSDRTSDDLIPQPWTEHSPVRLVTARTILLAGIANFLRDRRHAVGLVQRASACVNHRCFHLLFASMRGIAGEPDTSSASNGVHNR